MTSPISKSRSWVGPLIVTITALIMLIWSWGTWPDCVLDFGRELYVPWRLSVGDVLYRDIVSYFNGPLSPYLHALLFKIFGVSLRTLVMFNLLVIAALATMLYRLIARAFSPLAATTALVIFFILFAFAQLVFAGNYNFLCPYSYELPHGITLSVGAIYALDNWRLSDRRRWIVLTGALLGLVLLTKAEVFFAAAIAICAGLGLIFWIKRRRSIEGLIFLLAAIVPVLLAVLLLRVAGLTLSQSLRGIAGAWRWAGDRELLGMPYFKNLAGTADVGESVRTIMIWSLGYAIVFGLPIAAGFALRKVPRRSPSITAICLFLVLALIGLWNWQRINWNNAIRPVGVLLAIIAVIMLLPIVRKRRDDRWLLFVLVLWSLAMLAKMALSAHIEHYGFALAMPATLITLAILIDTIPRAIEHGGAKGGANGNLLRATVLAALVALVHPYLRGMNRYWSAKTVIVGEGGDAFRADWRGNLINRAIDDVSSLTPRDATLAIVPEGLIVNYLTRRVNPTGQLNFTPPAIVMYGESEMLGAFRAHRPDFVLFIGVDTAEYGPRFFGGDYARGLGSWIAADYRVVDTIGKGPFRENGFGAVLLQAEPLLPDNKKG